MIIHKFTDIFWNFPDIFSLKWVLKPIRAFKEKNEKFDYSLTKYWHLHPDKPHQHLYRKTIIENKNEGVGAADLFLVHRTTYFSYFNWNDSYTKKQREKLKKYIVFPIASIFSNHARVFAPFYRQATLYSYFEESNNSKKALDLAYEDVKSAFQCYLEKFDVAKRPIVLVGHSQGAHHITRLLHDFFDTNDALKRRLIVAYIVGWPISKDIFVNIKASNSPTDTNCFVSWCTFGKNAFPSYFKEQFENSYCINPISWKTDHQETKLSSHLGAISFGLESIDREMITCSIKRGVLQISRPYRFKYPCLPRRDFVIVDYHLFYNNIKQNFTTRFNMWVELNKLV